MVEEVKIGDRFIRPDSKKVYIVARVVVNGNWVVLKGEDEEGQILTSRESLESWIRKKGKRQENRTKRRKL